jgi:membrane-associated protease RseP (regulator of RpoE activity)
MTLRHAHHLLLAVTVACAVAGTVIPALPGTAAPTSAPGDVEPIVVPFKMLPSNHMVVEVRLNGKGPYRFIFDLGAPVTLLNNQAAEASGAIDKKAPRSFLMGTRGEGKIARLEMGDLRADDVPVIVMDHPALRALGGLFSRPLSGIIGYTFWARYKMTIDYQAQKMTFTPVEFEVRDLMKELPERMAGPKTARQVVHAPRALWGLDVAEADGADKGLGVRVTSVLPGGPAAAAGLEPGDLLTSLDGRWTTSVPDALAAAEGVEPNRPAAVVVLRAGAERTLTVTPRDGL